MYTHPPEIVGEARLDTRRQSHHLPSLQASHRVTLNLLYTVLAQHCSAIGRRVHRDAVIFRACTPPCCVVRLPQAYLPTQLGHEVACDYRSPLCDASMASWADINGADEVLLSSGARRGRPTSQTASSQRGVRYSDHAISQTRSDSV